MQVKVEDAVRNKAAPSVAAANGNQHPAKSDPSAKAPRNSAHTLNPQPKAEEAIELPVLTPTNGVPQDRASDASGTLQ